MKVICNILIRKANIHCEILMVKTALHLYQGSFELDNRAPVNAIKPIKARDIYCKFKYIREKECIYTCIRNDLDLNCSKEDELFAFTQKVVLEQEIKLREFNFKLLHGILPCNKNLINWNIRASYICDVCDQPQTIKHLLNECIYVKSIWKTVNCVFSTNTVFHQVLGLDKGYQYNAFATMICFLIYKEGLLLSLSDKNRNSKVPLSYFREELSLGMEIYKFSTNIKETHIDRLSKLVASCI